MGGTPRVRDENARAPAPRTGLDAVEATSSGGRGTNNEEDMKTEVPAVPVAAMKTRLGTPDGAGAERAAALPG